MNSANAHPGYTGVLRPETATIARLLRDAATLTRPSYLEIDLADLFGGQQIPAEEGDQHQLALEDVAEVREADRQRECVHID